MAHHSYHSETATLNRFILSGYAQQVEVIQLQLKALEEAEWDALPILREQSETLKALLDEMLAFKAGFDPNQPRVPVGNPNGGQWTISAPESWGPKETFENHYERHGKKVGARSAPDYAKRAQTFLKRGIAEKLPTIRMRDGHLKIYAPKSRLFGVYSPSGKTINFFKPRSRHYFSNEIEKALKKGGRIIHPLPEKPAPRPPNKPRSGGGRGGGGNIALRNRWFPNTNPFDILG